MVANSGQVTGSISVVALSFIVHEPSGIIDAVEREVLVGEPAQVAQHLRSRSGASWNTGWVRKSLVRSSAPGRASRVDASSASIAGTHAERRPDRRRRARASVVSSHAIADRVGVDEPQVDAALGGPPRAPRRRGPGRAPGHGVEERVVHDRRARRGAGPRPGSRRSRCDAPGDRCAARRARGRRRTSTPSRPAAPARCRCSTSPSRGGCAARGSAARGGSAGAPSASTDTPTRRPGSVRSRPCAHGHEAGVRAAEARAARRSAAWSRRRRRRPSRPAAAAASARAGRRRRRRSRRARARASITPRRSRDARRRRPGTAPATPKNVALAAGRSREVGDDDLDAERLGAGLDHADRLREDVGVDQEAGRDSAFEARRATVIASAAAVRLVEQRRVGDRQAGQVGDHRSGSSAAPRAGPARSPAGTACRRCTRPGSRARCAGSPAA